MKKIFFIILITSFSNYLFAYPITPRPLRKLVIESEYIVWAKVLEVGQEKQKDKKDDFWESDYALLQINEQLQGKLIDCRIKVYFSSGMICPAPGRFFEGEEVLAFLDGRKKMEGYWVHALSYGVKHGLVESEYKIYKERIREMQALREKDDSREKDEQILEWLVKCAEDPITRWEGVYELSPQSDFMSYYDRGSPIRKDIFLNTNQLGRLYNALFATDTLDYEDMGLVDIVIGINDKSLLYLLKSGLSKIDKENDWHAQFIMERIVQLTGDVELEKLLEEYDEVNYSYQDKEQKKAKKILNLFINKMKNVELKQKILASEDNDS